jgi:hypothetical protein
VEVLPPAVIPPKKKGQHGGPRPNSGRPRENQFRDAGIIRRLMRDGEATPAEVMITNMRYYWLRAEKLTDKLGELADLLTAEKIKSKDPEVLEMLKLMDKISTLRDQAQACAVDAAPYCHPKLAALQIKTEDSGDSSKPMVNITPQLSPREAVEAYAELLKRPI